MSSSSSFVRVSVLVGVAWLGAASRPGESSGAPDAGFGQRDARCGGALALDGDRLLIGCPGYDSPAGVDTGAAFVFARHGTSWAMEARLVASDAAATPSPPGSVLLPDAFGVSVSLSGDTAIVGSLFDDHAGGRDAGAAYVFVRSGSTWSEQQKLVASDAAADDRFGVSVSVAGDTAVVGSFRADHRGGEDAGAAYVFVRTGSRWSEQQKLVAEEAAAGDDLGVAVAVAGDTVIVGARRDDRAGQDAGAAHVFVRSGTKWSEQQNLIASDAAARDELGAAVALAGDTAIVGAESAGHGGRPSAGAAYVFVRSGSKWTQQGKLVASDAAAGDGFGHDVAVAGDTAVVGASDDDAAAGEDTGAVYVFARAASRWAERQKLVVSDAAAEDRFGAAVAVSGDSAAAGALNDDHDGNDAGSAYVFAREGAKWKQQQELVGRSTAAGPREVFSGSDRDALKRTILAMRDVGTAMGAWATDLIDAPDHGWPTEKETPAGANWSQCPSISYEDLRSLLTPRYLPEGPPRQDGWGHPLEFCLDRQGAMRFGMGVRSPGRDGRFEGSDYSRLGKFDPGEADRDIVWLDGLFVAWPQN